MKKEKIKISEQEFNEWEFSGISEKKINNKTEFGWKVDNKFIVKVEHDFIDKYYEVEYVKINAGMAE